MKKSNIIHIDSMLDLGEQKLAHVLFEVAQNNAYIASKIQCELALKDGAETLADFLVKDCHKYRDINYKISLDTGVYEAISRDGVPHAPQEDKYYLDIKEFNIEFQKVILYEEMFYKLAKLDMRLAFKVVFPIFHLMFRIVTQGYEGREEPLEALKMIRMRLRGAIRGGMITKGLYTPQEAAEYILELPGKGYQLLRLFSDLIEDIDPEVWNLLYQHVTRLETDTIKNNYTLKFGNKNFDYSSVILLFMGRYNEFIQKELPDLKNEDRTIKVLEELATAGLTEQVVKCMQSIPTPTNDNNIKKWIGILKRITQPQKLSLKEMFNRF